jgi:hypothetical protein
MLDIAQGYLDRGISVVPMWGKACYIEGWQRFADVLATPQELRHLFAQRPSKAGGKLPTGLAYVPGPASWAQHPFMYALEFEGRHREEAEPWLDRHIPGWREGTVAESGSDPPGSLHLYLRASSPVGLSDHQWGEVRGQGGITVLPPSIHPSTGRAYHWLSQGPAQEADPDKLPLTYVSGTGKNGDGHGKRGYQPLVDGVVYEHEGRNKALYSLGCSLRANGFDEGVIGAAVRAANQERCAPPLPEDEIANIVRSAAKRPKGTQTGRATAPSQPSQATRMVDLVTARGAKLFHAPGGDAYFQMMVDLPAPHREVHALHSGGARYYLEGLYYHEARTAPGSQALQDALNLLSAMARLEGEERQVHVRLASDPQGGCIYLDLGNPAWQVIKITPDGWDIVEEPEGVPVTFRRPRKMLALPRPVHPKQGEGFSLLHPFLNVKDEGDRALLAAFMAASLRPQGPYPILLLTGEAGAAKSTTARLLKDLLDPSVAPLRSQPRTIEDLMIGANNSWLLAFDNLSHIQDWLSDGLCRVATGGGIGKRTLYTDEDETVLDVQRPVVLSSIEEVITRGDLLDRAIVLPLAAIPEGESIPELELRPRLEAIYPSVLGALCDGVSAALFNLPRIKLEWVPRMADFAKWSAASVPTLGFKSSTFTDAYKVNRASAQSLVLDAEPVVTRLIALMKTKLKPGEPGQKWEGTATELLALLSVGIDEEQRRAEGWPRRGDKLSNVLRRTASALRRIAGLDVHFSRPSGKRMIAITYLEKSSAK